MPAPITTYRSLGYLGLAREATPGTREAPTKFFKFLDSPSFRAEQAIINYRDGNKRDFTVPLKETAGYHGSSGRLLTYADEGAALIAWAFGKDVVSGGGDPYTHTITLLDTLPWLGAEIGYAEGSNGTTNQQVDGVVDVKVRQLTIEGQAGKQIYLTAELDGLVASFRDTSVTSQSFSDAVANGPYTFQQSVFTMTSLGTDSSTMAGQIQDFKIMLNQNNEVVYGPAQLPGIGVVERGRECTLEFTVVFSSSLIYRLGFFGAVGGTAFSAVVGQGTFAIKATAQAMPEHSLLLTCNQFDIEDVQVLLAPNADLCTAKVRGHMLFSGSTFPLTCVALNAQSVQYTA